MGSAGVGLVLLCVQALDEFGMCAMVGVVKLTLDLTYIVVVFHCIGRRGSMSYCDPGGSQVNVVIRRCGSSGGGATIVKNPLRSTSVRTVSAFM